MPRFVALIRGINVGGNTMLKMSDLKACLERAGLENVVTYINSGNVGLDSVDDESTIVGKLERAIESIMDKNVPVMVRPQSEIARIIAANPFAGQFESHKEMHVLFLKEPLSATQLELLASLTPVGERFAAVGRELYCHLPMGVADSFLGRGQFEKKLKAAVTARNWRTVEKLAVL